MNHLSGKSPGQGSTIEHHTQQLPVVSSFTSPPIKRTNQLMNLFNQGNSDTQPQNDISSALPMHLQSTWKKKGKKASQILYDEIYKDIVEKTQSSFREVPDQNLKIGNQDYKCWSCHSPITLGFWNIGSTCEYCNYTGRWYCYNCLSDVRMPIPWKALQFFDLKSYKVSQFAKSEIDKLYDLPLLNIPYDSQLVTRSKTLFEFLVLKRQIHLLYDTICDTLLMQQLFEKRMNLCLKENIFSLKDLFELYNGSLYKLLESYLNILNKHILYCKVEINKLNKSYQFQSCQQKGQVCQICNQIQVVHAYDIRNATYCEKCNNLYHRQCLESKNCPSCLVNTK